MSLVRDVLDELGYSESPNFLRPGRDNSFDVAADFAHVFRRAQEPCGLRGVYSLRDSSTKGRASIVPLVYVCEADSEDQAAEIHRRVWNQNVVPFLIVASRQSVRLYPGFRYQKPQAGADPSATGIIRAARDMNAALEFLEAFRAARIDDGTVWQRWGNEVTPETRVDWKLLSSLNALDTWLRTEGGLDPQVSHSLIGKYVYLHYLRHRDILSNRKLEKWGLEEHQIFGRTAQVSAFCKVVEELDAWLNGCVFPLKSSGPDRPRQEHIRKVAGTFAGDDPTSRQLALDFGSYDFSFIPIETLSVIYEQFLHAPTQNGESTRGRQQGAYYTPLPLVNFMLEELDHLHPLKPGMKVLDPACGSGAFLVQCYRRIIEQDGEFEFGKPMRPARLRELLEEHIFGIDRDEEACRVAELSLSLTLLDYVDPPDLERTPRFRLPELHDRNIFNGDFFDPEAAWCDQSSEKGFDWIVGNPPWIELKRGRVSENDGFVWSWMQNKTNQRERPIGGNQVAEAFAWEVVQYLCDKGSVGLLLPAMTLFKDESTAFRQRFFSSLNVFAVANFANLAYVLFPGHRFLQGRRTLEVGSERPAAALFYSKCRGTRVNRVNVFSPFVVDQPAGRPANVQEREDMWSIVVDSNRVCSFEVGAVSTGAALPWKTAMWGSGLDIRILESLSARFPSLEVFLSDHGLKMAEGFQLRLASSPDATIPVPYLVGRDELKMNTLKNCGRIFEFPEGSLEPIDESRANLRLRGGTAGLTVSEPPHVVVDKARRFAVYSNEFIAVPPRQIGISGSSSQVEILKALALYLVSDFATYHQFLLSPEWGVSTSISTLDTLRSLPVPFGGLDSLALAEWAQRHARIVSATRALTSAGRLPFDLDDNPKMPLPLGDLLSELNSAVFDLLQLSEEERFLVSDLVGIRMHMVKGKVTADVIRKPSTDELLDYGTVLLGELDSFIDDQPTYWHTVNVFREGQSAIVGVTLHNGGRRPRGKRVSIVEQDSSELNFSAIRQRVRGQQSQWLYFRRNLRLYEGPNTYVFKPLERLHWTKSQALVDAGTIISETLT